MIDEHAAKLSAADRRRIEKEIASLDIGSSDELSNTDIADTASDVYQEEVDVGRLDELREELAAVERAEQRLHEGQFGLSIESGARIPDERLEAFPTAERTFAEEQRFEHRRVRNCAGVNAACGRAPAGARVSRST